MSKDPTTEILKDWSASFHQRRLVPRHEAEWPTQRRHSKKGQVKIPTAHILVTL